METQNWCPAITENGKNGCSSPKTRPRAKLPITDPPKVWVSGFLSVDGNTKLVSAITESWKNGSSSPKTCPRAKLPITDPPKVWVSSFLSVDENAKLVSAITENGKNGHSSPKTRPRAKLPITDPHKVWVSSFLSVDGNAKLVLAITENGKKGRNSPKMRPRAKLPITDPLKFGSPHESVLEQGFSFYPTSHLCVVLHFLIFSIVFNRVLFAINMEVRDFLKFYCRGVRYLCRPQPPPDFLNQRLLIPYSLSVNRNPTKHTSNLLFCLHIQ